MTRRYARRDGVYAPPAATETAEHAALFDWLARMRPAYPALAYAIHVPNEGRRAPWKAARMGISAGVPDVLVLCPSRDGRAHGLAIELKGPRGRTTPAQDAWLSRLAAAGWLTYVEVLAVPGDWTRVAVAIADHVGAPGAADPSWRVGA